MLYATPFFFWKSHDSTARFSLFFVRRVVNPGIGQKDTPWKFNIALENIPFPKGNENSNHDFSGAMLNFGGVSKNDAFGKVFRYLPSNKNAENLSTLR